ncbi:hypothetical protein ACLOAV_009409 [Pseudogymnoascus australis]
MRELNRLFDPNQASLSALTLVNITQCVRVITKNPISCRPGAAISLSSTWFNVTSNDGLCELNRYTPSRNPLQRQLVVKSMCTHDDVGQGTMVMAATNQYAHWLAVAINDDANAPPTGSASSKCALSCTVDTRDVYEYRQVTLQLQLSKDSTSRIARFLTSTGGTCTGPPLDRSLAAITAAANWQIRTSGLVGGELQASDARKLIAQKAELRAQKLAAAKARKESQALNQARKQLHRAGIEARKQERLRKKSVAQLTKMGLPIPPELEDPITNPEAESESQYESASEGGRRSGSEGGWESG